MNRWFCYDKEENYSLPLDLSFLSSERRQPVKLAIRRVIWQAAQSAFAVPLHLLNFTKPCSVALVHIKKIHSWKRPQRMTVGGSGPVFCSGRHGSPITVAIRGVSKSVSWKVWTLSLKHSPFIETRHYRCWSFFCCYS